MWEQQQQQEVFPCGNKQQAAFIVPLAVCFSTTP